MVKTQENSPQGQGLIANTQGSQCPCHNVGNKSSKPFEKGKRSRRKIYMLIIKMQEIIGLPQEITRKGIKM